MSYDRALTVFSPDGHLFQIDYAMEAVARGTTAVGIRTPHATILAAERRSLRSLQDPRTVHKIVKLDDHLVAAFAGLTADARVLVNKARVECQSHRLTVEDAPTVEHVARYVAGVQQRYTQRGGARPFGVNMLVAGIDGVGEKARARLWMTDCAGIHSEWRAAVVGRSSKVVREFLEKAYAEESALKTADEGVRLAVRALLEVVQTGVGFIEVAVVEARNGEAVIEYLSSAAVAEIVKTVEAEKEAEAEKKRKPAAITAE